MKREILAKEVVRINPINQMPVDASVWSDAHSYHSRLSELHSSGAHRSGIVYGLEVLINKEGDGVTVLPGLALDNLGRLILLRESKRLKVDGERGTRCIMLDYAVAEDKQKVVKVQGQPQSYRILEEPQLRVSDPQSRSDGVELGRVSRSGPRSQVRDPENPLDPQRDEINLLYRVYSFPYCYADGSVCELPFDSEAGGDTPPNRMGLMNLLREVRSQGFHVAFGGLFGVHIPEDLFLIYGAALGPFNTVDSKHVDAIKKFRDQGGTVFLEAIDDNKEALDQLRSFAKELGGKELTEVGQDHELLTAHFLFPSVPEGSHQRPKMWTDNQGLVLSVANYGGGWQGYRMPDRSSVRNSIEFGQNLLAYAYQRKRRLEIMRWLTEGA